MALDEDHLFKGFATLELTKSPFKRWAEVLGFDRVEYFAHRRITRNPPDAVNALQVVLGPLLVKGEKRRRFEREHGQGGHEDITQRDLGIAFSVIRNLTKDVLNRAQQGIGTKMFSQFRNHHA